MADEIGQEQGESGRDRRSFSSRIFSLFRRGSEQQEHKVGPSWWQNAIKGMSPEDAREISKLRRYFTDKGLPQHWYYSGAGSDISPTLIAPHQSEHWFIDPSYDSSNNLHRVRSGEELTEPYRRLGAEVHLDNPWDDAWRLRSQTIRIGEGTAIRLAGGRTQDIATVPDSIDVIYTNPFSTTPGPDALSRLRKGGLYIFTNDRPDGEKPIAESFGKTLEDLGFRLVYTSVVGNYHFPNAGKIRSSSEGKPIIFQVYEKTRDFTPVEEDLLHLDSSLREILEEFDEFVFRYDTGNFPVERAYQLEADLRTAITRYFVGVKNLKSDDRSYSETMSARLKTYFETDEDLPEAIKKRYYFKVRDPEKVKQYYSQARNLYIEIKQQFEGTEAK